MYIIVGEESAKAAEEKYIVLELDTVRYSKDKDPIKTYCVIDNEHIPLTDINRIDEFRNLHNKLLENYRKRNWKFCEDALVHLRGSFRGELDTFYDDIEKRVSVFQQFSPADNWDGVYDKTS